jgi:hypothetical protein
MEQENAGFRLKVKWKLEKFEGEEAIPFETLTGEDVVEVPQEVANAVD